MFKKITLCLSILTALAACSSSHVTSDNRAPNAEKEIDPPVYSGAMVKDEISPQEIKGTSNDIKKALDTCFNKKDSQSTVGMRTCLAQATEMTKRLAIMEQRFFIRRLDWAKNQELIRALQFDSHGTFNYQMENICEYSLLSNFGGTLAGLDYFSCLRNVYSLRISVIKGAYQVGQGIYDTASTEENKRIQAAVQETRYYNVRRFIDTVMRLEEQNKTMEIKYDSDKEYQKAQKIALSKLERAIKQVSSALCGTEANGSGLQKMSEERARQEYIFHSCTASVYQFGLNMIDGPK